MKGYIWVDGKRKLTPPVNERGHPLPNPFWTDKRINKVKELYLEGKSIRYISNHFKLCSHGSITAIVTKNGWVRNKKIYKKDEKFISDVCELYKKGKTCAKIAIAFQVSPTTIEDIVKEHGLMRSVKSRLRIRSNNTNYLKMCIDTISSKLSEENLDYVTYLRNARYITNFIYSLIMEDIDPNKKRSRNYCIDHIYPIRRGYYKLSGGKEVKRKKYHSLSFICHPTNFQFLTCKKNLKKRSKIGKSFKKLKEEAINYKDNSLVQYVLGLYGKDEKWLKNYL